MELNHAFSNQNLIFSEMDSNQNPIFREFESRAINWARQLHGRLGSLLTEKKRETSDLGSEWPASSASGLWLRQGSRAPLLAMPTTGGKPLGVCFLGPNINTGKPRCRRGFPQFVHVHSQIPLHGGSPSSKLPPSPVPRGPLYFPTFGLIRLRQQSHPMSSDEAQLCFVARQVQVVNLEKHR
jgi:hypothetical protein